MDNNDLDQLLERGFSGEPARAGLREQALRDSLAALARRRARRTAWRVAWLSAAAVLIAGVSFLLGRCAPPAQRPAVTPVARANETVAVPRELVAWLEAARFFKQVGMPERVAHAYERASALVPQDMATGGGPAGPVLAVAEGRGKSQSEPREPSDRMGRRPSAESMGRIMAQSFGD